MGFRTTFIAGAAALVALSSFGSAAQPASERRAAPGARATDPVVVELFTAQGCSGCPEANRVVEALSERPGVIALTYAVDYWDYLGWPDTFARPEFAERQAGYRRALRLRNIYTPQVVIDGRRQAPGAAGPAVREAMQAAAADRQAPPDIEFRETGDRVGVGSGRMPSGGADVWAVTYTPGPQVVVVNGGDNRGQTVRHVNVVRSLRKLGPWTGRPVLYALPDGRATGETVAILVQGRADRHILSAAVL